MKLKTYLLLLASFLFLFSASSSAADYTNYDFLFGTSKYYYAEVQNRLQRSSGFVFKNTPLLEVASQLSKLTGLRIVVDSSVVDEPVSFLLTGSARDALIAAAAQSRSFVNVRNGYLELSRTADFLCSLSRPLTHRELQSLFYLIKNSPSKLLVDQYKLKAHLDFDSFLKFKEASLPLRIVRMSLLFDESL